MTIPALVPRLFKLLSLGIADCALALLTLPAQASRPTDAQGYPLVAGDWLEESHAVKVVQAGGQFSATCTYGNVSWRMEGTIGRDGVMQARLTHTAGVAPSAAGYRQARRLALSADGMALEGAASFTGGGHPLKWTRSSPLPAAADQPGSGGKAGGLARFLSRIDKVQQTLDTVLGDGKTPETSPSSAATPAVPKSAVVEKFSAVATTAAPKIAAMSAPAAVSDSAPASSATAAAWPTARSQSPQIALRAGLDINSLTATQFNGAVSAAMEAMRLVQEPMTPAETQKFEAKWAPLFNFPTAEAVDYFNKLNPLLDEFLRLRGLVVRGAMALDEGWLEAKYAAGYESERGARQAMAAVARQTEIMQSVQSRLAEVTRRIAAFGDPPDPLALRAAARKRHEEAVKSTREVLPGLTLAPARVSAPPDSPVTFTPKGRNLPAGTTLEWAFGDGKTAKGGVATMKHAYAKAGTYVVTVTARSGAKGSTASAKAEVAISKTAAAAAGSGAWVLTEISYYPSAELVSKEIVIKSSTDPNPSWSMRVGDEVYRDDKTYQLVHSGERLLTAKWQQPPAKGQPGQLASMPWALTNHGVFASTFLSVVCVWYNEDWMVGDPDGPGWKGAAPTTPNAPYPTSGEFKFKFPRPPTAGQTGFFTVTFSLSAGCTSNNVHVESGHGPTQYRYRFVADATMEEEQPAPAVDDSARLAEEAKQQEILEHKNNILAIEKARARDQEDLAHTTDSWRRTELESRLRTAEADIQAERDLINGIESGVFVHTRTTWDEYAHAQFVGRIQKEQQTLSTILKILDHSQRLIDMAPASEADHLREFASRQLTPDLIAKMDVQKAREAMNAIGTQVQGYNQGVSATQEEKAAWQNFGMEAAQNIKAGADAAMTATSFFGGKPINLLYQAATGYVEGGPVTALKQSAAALSETADYAITAYDGYQKEGLRGAVKDAGLKYLQSKALAWVGGKLAANPNLPTVQQRFDAAKFRQERQWGEALVKDFQRAQAEIRAAGFRGAPAETITRLQAAARDKAAAVASSLHAKNYLKYKCDTATGRAYDAHMRAVHAEVDARTMQQMSRDGWNTQQWELREFRNASSYGKPNMDRDVGLREKPIWSLDEHGNPLKGADGKPVPNPERWQTKDGKLVLQPQVTKNGQAKSINDWQGDATDAYNRAYRAVTGRSATMAMEGVTTSAHPEAYKDMKWLGGCDLPEAAWSAQAADVTRYKINAPGHADPASSYFTKMQEVARGTSKDMESKLLPLLERAKPAASNTEAMRRHTESLSHWRKVNTVLSAYGKNEIDPLYAHRRIAELTGGKSIPEVVDEMGSMMEATVKFGVTGK